MTKALPPKRLQLKEIRTEINRLAYSMQQSLFLQIRDDLDELARSLLSEGCSADEVIATFRPESKTSIQYRLTRAITHKERAAAEARPNNAREANHEEA